MCKHDEFKLYYAFEIYTNPNTQKNRLLFWGVASYCTQCQKIFKFNNDIWAYNKYGYTRLKRYSDYIEKYGKLPCIIVDHSKLPLDINTTYPNESFIRKTFDVKASETYNGHSKINPDAEANSILELEDTLLNV